MIKIDGIEVNVRGWPAGQQIVPPPRVALTVATSIFSRTVAATPDQARELAAQLQLAANVAEGKA